MTIGQMVRILQTAKESCYHRGKNGLGIGSIVIYMRGDTQAESTSQTSVAEWPVWSSRWLVTQDSASIVSL